MMVVLQSDQGREHDAGGSEAAGEVCRGGYDLHGAIIWSEKECGHR